MARMKKADRQRFLLEYYIQRGKTDYRYLNKIAQSWHEMKITTLEQAQHYITMNEDKWAKIRHILKYLGINNPLTKRDTTK